MSIRRFTILLMITALPYEITKVIICIFRRGCVKIRNQLFASVRIINAAAIKMFLKAYWYLFRYVGGEINRTIIPNFTACRFISLHSVRAAMPTVIT